jgi:hypothetical protein
MSDPLIRLIYRSDATQSVDRKLLRDIETTSKQYNQAHEITGLLVATEHQFLQVLEGPRAALNRLYTRIIRDPRHENCIILTYHKVVRRGFEDWSMRTVGLGLLGQWLDQWLEERYEGTSGNIVLPDDEANAYALLGDVQTRLRLL